ncbi:hypothetical protein [Thermus scotoductus]|uniref:hypothetical protein n=1 Tax=Thermus scotoductus TaxID=37636 RepID=UPI001562D0F4|nr:hypothetical protein [Thermus scotoductus]
MEEGLLGVHRPVQEQVLLEALEAVVPPPGAEEGPGLQEVGQVHGGIIAKAR